MSKITLSQSVERLYFTVYEVKEVDDKYNYSSIDFEYSFYPYDMPYAGVGKMEERIKKELDSGDNITVSTRRYNIKTNERIIVYRYKKKTVDGNIYYDIESFSLDPDEPLYERNGRDLAVANIIKNRRIPKGANPRDGLEILYDGTPLPENNIAQDTKDLDGGSIVTENESETESDDIESTSWFQFLSGYTLELVKEGKMSEEERKR